MLRRTCFSVMAIGLLACWTAAAYAQSQPSGTEAPGGDDETPALTGPATTGPSEGAGGQGGAPAKTKSDKPNWSLPLIMIGGILLLYLWMGRSRRKQESKRREMLAAIKKGDKATSIGGIIGTVVEVREDEVIMKIDDTNNVRVHLARWAVRGVGEEAKKEDTAEKK